MTRPMTQALSPADRALTWAQQAALVVVASIFVALCARVTLPLPFTPVPLTMQNFGVLLVGLMLGRERGFAALALYLAEGLAGMPVFNPTGPGGLAQLLGPTGGYLFAYPFVAALAGYHGTGIRNILSRGHSRGAGGNPAVCQWHLVAGSFHALFRTGSALRVLLVHFR